jgi:hypothetical protein
VSTGNVGLSTRMNACQTRPYEMHHRATLRGRSTRRVELNKAAPGPRRAEYVCPYGRGLRCVWRPVQAEHLGDDRSASNQRSPASASGYKAKCTGRKQRLKKSRSPYLRTAAVELLGLGRRSYRVWQPGGRFCSGVLDEVDAGRRRGSSLSCDPRCGARASSRCGCTRGSSNLTGAGRPTEMPSRSPGP